MLRITATFPLGVYHALSGADPDEPEWPPSPVRLVGALLAAAHGRRGGDLAADRALVERLCALRPPLIVAPASTAVGEPAQDGAVARLRGATRWVPRNYIDKRDGISPRNLGRERASVSKAGVAIGERPVHFVWTDATLDADDLRRLALLASDVVFLGTTRSPALLAVAADAALPSEATWAPSDHAADAVAVRVPDVGSPAAFDRREAARRSTRGRVEPTGMIAQDSVGRPVRYARPGVPTGAGRGGAPHGAALRDDPRWWGEMLVLAVDPSRSEVQPKAPAAYLLARAVRAALLSVYDDPGASGEAPPILVGRDSEPHCAFVPLPHVWGEHGDGRLLGVAVVLPHERRVPDLAAQRARVEAGLRTLLDGSGAGGPLVRLPGGGTVALAAPTAADMRKRTLQTSAYTRPATRWATVTPVVHGRWRKGGIEGLLRQVTADCEHVGLPAPAAVELLHAPGRRGGAARVIPHTRVPAAWRGPLQGPSDHVEITFDHPVRGPLLLGKARHFGLGLCVPTPARRTRAASEDVAA